MSQPAGAGDGLEEISLYAKWRKIYPLWVTGGFQTWRRVTLVLLLLFYYAGPWLQWKGQPGFLFDLEHRKFTVMFSTFVPEEFILLAWAMIIAAFALFFVTVVAGRIWCGWACPQTVWALVYFTVEYWIEGDRNTRLRLDRGPWNARRIRKKALKYSIWAALALSISITFVGYFEPIREFLPRLLSLDISSTEGWAVALPALASFMFSGVLREQVCFHMCPYARFQSVMMDRDTLIISYDAERGDPRGKRRRGTEPAEAGLGSCIDCQKCVSVCPTGIDIRDGLQYQCIGCANCIDVCNDVMDQMGYPRDLVRYSSENHDEHTARSWMRPRLIGYMAMLSIVSLAFTWQVTHRASMSLDVSRDRGRLYRANWDGSVENVYTLHIQNRTQEPQHYALDVDGEVAYRWEGPREILVAPGERKSVPIRLVMPAETPTANAHSDLRFVLEVLGTTPAEGEEPAEGMRTEKLSRFVRPEAEPIEGAGS